VAASPFPARSRRPAGEGSVMRSILLYFLGVPIPVILLLAMCTHHF
jgi:hypothetical protein